MARTGNRRYRRERAAVLRGDVVCWLCGQPIDKTLAWPDPMSGSADHVQAHHDGGHDGRSNLRPSHLGCNSRRGKRDQGTVLRRSSTFDPPGGPPGRDAGSPLG